MAEILSVYAESCTVKTCIHLCVIPSAFLCAGAFEKYLTYCLSSGDICRYGWNLALRKFSWPWLTSECKKRTIIQLKKASIHLIIVHVVSELGNLHCTVILAMRSDHNALFHIFFYFAFCIRSMKMISIFILQIKFPVPWGWLPEIWVRYPGGSGSQKEEGYRGLG